MNRLFLRKSQKITKQADFRNVISHKIRAGSGLIALYVCPNDVQVPRLGLTISGYIRPVITRNRIKRLAREVFRQNQHILDPHFDYVLIFNPKMTKKKSTSKDSSEIRQYLEYAYLEKSLLRLMKTAVEKSKL